MKPANPSRFGISNSITILDSGWICMFIFSILFEHLRYKSEYQIIVFFLKLKFRLSVMYSSNFWPLLRFNRKLNNLGIFVAQQCARSFHINLVWRHLRNNSVIVSSWCKWFIIDGTLYICLFLENAINQSLYYLLFDSNMMDDLDYTCRYSLPLSIACD